MRPSGRGQARRLHLKFSGWVLCLRRNCFFVSPYTYTSANSSNVPISKLTLTSTSPPPSHLISHTFHYFIKTRNYYDFL
ncbi:hypothetical protein K439DRAFT_1640978 [Ramaria rubella]|nr:hypothetical protein K439DRAFT_1640978 [Ramaria rubella]